MDIGVPVWLNPGAFGCPDPPAADQPALAMRCFVRFTSLDFDFVRVFRAAWLSFGGEGTMGIETTPLLPLVFEVLKTIEAADLHENALDAICAALKLGQTQMRVAHGTCWLNFLDFLAQFAISE